MRKILEWFHTDEILNSEPTVSIPIDVTIPFLVLIFWLIEVFSFKSKMRNFIVILRVISK